MKREKEVDVIVEFTFEFDKEIYMYPWTLDNKILVDREMQRIIHLIKLEKEENSRKNLETLQPRTDKSPSRNRVGSPNHPKKVSVHSPGKINVPSPTPKRRRESPLKK